MLLSVIIPAFNEIRSIAEIVERVANLPVEKEIILVDNVSTDGTREWIRDYPGEAVRILHTVNSGKGSSVRDGLAAATGEIAVIQDADLEYDPEEIPMLMKPIENGEADVVFGSRILGGKKGGSLLYDFGGRFLNSVTNLLFGGRLTDAASCYKLMSKNVYKSLTLVSNGFDLDFEMPARFLLRKYRMVELPVSYHPRTMNEGKKIKVIDGVKAVWMLIKLRVGYV